MDSLTQPHDAALSASRDPDAARWAAFARRDATADGSFVVCVRTTKIYCRPSCPARRAKRENVEFRLTCAAAEAAGYRACKRCRPNEASHGERQVEAVARACRLIEEAEAMPSLEALAKAAGLSAFHFHRVFKAATGVTPRAYASQHRAARVASGLRSAETITGAVYDAGFNASSRFYETTNARLGMTPSAYRDGGTGTTIRFAVAECSLGAVLVAATAKGICAIMLGDDPEVLARELQDRFGNAEIIGGDAGFESVVAQVVGFVEAPHRGFDLPLDVSGTAFQQRVWEALQKIPAGRTMTYAEVAAAIGAPKAVRAVGTACGANPVAVAIPCHRVVQSGNPQKGGNYRWGIERKRALIAREAAQR